MNHVSIQDMLLLNQEQQHRLTQALERYLDQLERGELPDLEALCAEYPDLVDSLQQYIPSLKSSQGTSLAQSKKVQPAAAPEAAIDPALDDHAVPKRLGDYELLEEIGRGGMGIVFRARQISLDRTVAIKILAHAAVWDAKQIARFQNEAQAAAQLSHPNIVSVHSIGKERGTYYYSMPLIQGISLEQAIRSLCADPKFSFSSIAPASDSSIPNTPRRLDLSRQKTLASNAEAIPVHRNTGHGSDAERQANELRARKAIQCSSHIRAVLELVAQAAEALHYAHQHGIVHRDIKPSNLLVDHDGKLWITDFGLAQVSGHSGLTCSGDVLGTLKYMSPEQASGKSHWVDHRSDIYSLGITLYELLTLHPVVDSDDRMTMMKQIQIVSPPAARTRNPAIPPVLENILSKAISKDREDRYASAQLFAEDLRRFLTSGRSLAHRPSLFHSISRIVRRNAQWSALALTVLLLMLATTLPFSYWISRQNLRMGDQNYRTSQQLSRANETLQHLGSDWMQRLQWIPGTDLMQRELANESIRYLDSFLTHAEQSPLLQPQVTATMIQIASLHEQQGSFPDALAGYQRAIDHCNSTLANGTSFVNPNELLQAYHGLANTHARMGNLDLAVKILRDLLEAPDRPGFIAATPEESRYPYWEAVLRLNLSSFYTPQGATLPAEKQLKTALQLLQTASRSKNKRRPNDPVFDRMLIAALIQNANFDATNAEIGHRLIESAIEIATQDRSPKTKTLLDDYQLAVCYLAFGVNASRLGEANDSVLWFQRATQVTQGLTKREPSNFKYWYEHAAAVNSLGQAELALGNLDSARESFSSAVRILEDIDPFQPNPNYRSNLAGAMHNLAAVAIRKNEPREAKGLLERAIQRQSQALESCPDNPRFRSMLQQHRKTLDELKKPVATQSGH